MAIDTLRQVELQHLVTEVRRAARTLRAQTRLERDTVRRTLAEALRDDLEPRAEKDLEGLEAIRAWASALEDADVGDADLLPGAPVRDRRAPARAPLARGRAAARAAGGAHGRGLLAVSR